MFSIYDVLVHGYYQVISVFPPAVQWIVTLALLVGLVMGLLALVRANALFLILLVLLLPAMIPVLGKLIGDLWGFLLFVIHQLGAQTPSG